VSIEPGQNVVFRPDGRVEHTTCPEVICPVCSQPIDQHDPIRRDGDRLVHGNCWVRLHRSMGKPPVKIAGDGATVVSDEVGLLIRSRLAAGTLPRAKPEKIWARLGNGKTCSGCDRPITRGEVEHEVDALDHGTGRFHRTCLDIWQAEVARYGREISGGSAPRGSGR
jgi:hypothetical protein